MNAILRLLVLLPGVLFLVMGLRWLLAPRGIAPEFGLTLQSGVGLSSQIGDMAAFFLLLGICILTALVTQRRFWYYPPMILLSLTALSRVLFQSVCASPPPAPCRQILQQRPPP